MLQIIKYRNIWYLLSITLLVLSFIGVWFRGIDYGLDFTGGSLMEVVYTQEPTSSERLHSLLSDLGVKDLQIQKLGEKGYLFRMAEISDEKRQEINKALRKEIGQTADLSVVKDVNGQNNTGVTISNVEVDGSKSNEQGTASQNRVSELRFESIGPVIGQELKVRSWQAIVLVLIMILVYVAVAFKGIAWPVKSWKYGVIAVVTLFHDVIITFGAYIWVGSWFGWEVDTVFIAALLTVLGYSVNDTIVVFDRVRENLPRQSGDFETIVNDSVNQTLTRSINTGLCALIVLLCIFLLGGSTLQGFVFSLIVGIFLGTYSSIFIASPMLVSWNRWSKRKSQ